MEIMFTSITDYKRVCMDVYLYACMSGREEMLRVVFS